MADEGLKECARQIGRAGLDLWLLELSGECWCSWSEEKQVRSDDTAD